MSFAETFEFDRIPIIVQFSEPSAMVETYGFVGSQGVTFLEGQLLKPRGAPSRTLYLFMHPASTLQLMPMPAAMAATGCHVLCAGSRFAKNDSALVMEKVAVDMGAYIRHAREALGYEKVVLVGWSGGGALSLFYQAQAESPTITHTPAGDPYDLTRANLPRADGLVFIAAHLSRPETLTEWMDPSVIDELEPDARDLGTRHPRSVVSPPAALRFRVRGAVPVGSAGTQPEGSATGPWTCWNACDCGAPNASVASSCIALCATCAGSIWS